MTRGDLYDICEDVLLSALETGARLPSDFTIQVEGCDEIFRFDPMVIRIAGFHMTVRPEQAPRTEGAA